MATSLSSLPLLTSFTLSNNNHLLRANGVSPSLHNNNPSAFAVLAAEEATTKQKGKALLKPLKDQQVVLRFVWMEKNIGLGLDQIVPGYGTLPLSPYYFWPCKDAWEELKTELERRKWISKQLAVLLLNQATDIINLWQQNASP